MRIAVDTGGTFTDCVWTENGRLQILKVFSTPNDPSEAIANAVARIRGKSNREVVLLHGTTVGTNALLQRKGARTALVTTAGFEDAIEIGRQARPNLYDLNVRRIEPLVPRELRFGLAERTRPNGSIERAPSQEDLAELRSRVRESGAESVAVCLLFSFANAANEEAIEQEVRALKLPLSLSHRILPEFREYERMSTVAVNAYLQPLMQRYLESLRARLSKQAAAKLFVMQSSGGITALETAASQPVRTVLSGPAGGAVGALEMGRRAGFEKIISFDMGGTSTDVALLEGRLQVTSEAEIAGLPVRVPMLNIHTVGAGGGSLARLDAGGALRVGPESAGADPGPICYGKGDQPTVTDANLLLGRLRPENFLGGEFRLDVERTRAIFIEWIKRNRLKWSPEDLAAGIVRVVNATMEKAIRVVSIEQGYDARDFALLSFGGAGALHACDLAGSLSISRVIVPPAPGALSAYGILSSAVVKDFSRTAPMLLSGEGFSRLGKKIEADFARLKAIAAREYASEEWEGKVKMEGSVDLRYLGQGYELNIPWRNSSVLLEDFHAAHQRRFGYNHSGKKIELVTLRLRTSLPQPSATMGGSRTERADKITSSRTSVYFDSKSLKTRVLQRDSLHAGFSASGPLVVTEYTATTVVPPGWRLTVHPSGALLIGRSSQGNRRSS
ncbi:MAG: 5-oxoprolinase [Acidobacteria bacterium]|nr:MAG: 5-oxoprolinase [Acidobacteriota bacterium]